MKVCIITNIPSPYRVDFFNYLIDNSDYDMTIIYSSRNEDNRSWKIDKRLLRNSIFLKSKTIKIKKKMDNKYIHIPVDIIPKLNNIKPDVVVGSEYNPTVIQAFLWCKLKKRKFISWSDGTLNSEKNINRIQLLFRKLICKNSDAFIASSSATKNAQLKYGAKIEKIFISLLTVDINKYLIKKDFNRYDEVPQIIYVGSLIKRKGVDLLFHALSLTKEKFILNIVGEGEEKENLISLSKTLKIDDNVKFLGYFQQNELKKLYSKSDIFILPTREDCYGLVILEAMCAALPVIVSKYADGVYDLTENGENGIIVNPFDTEKFALEIDKLLIDKGLCKIMGQKSKSKVKGFLFENVASGFINAIKFVTDKIS